MAKKVKKQARSGKKDNRGSTTLRKDPTEQAVSTNSEIVEDVIVGNEKKICPHFDKGIALEIVTSKISSAEHIRCEDCKVCVTEKKANKGKGKKGNKKGGSSADSKCQSKAIWVCLECGCFHCGGIGLPTVPRSHAVQHAKLTNHQLAIQYENLRLRWCFLCNTLIPVEKNSENGENIDPLSDIIKVIKGRSIEKVSANVEDVWFGTGSILNEIKSENTSIQFTASSGYVVRGLSNLGNTCFFNSIMQNLLALDKLREHYLDLNESIGPLAVSFKKIFVETFSSGLRNVINPRSFFGCICVKSPQFRGFQQHDSHELLRCLLDGLSTEELNANKRNSRENGIANQDPTFVDAVFGGQLSSTVSCLDCGHSSKVFEPFLDLSLPVPTKRPPSKTAIKKPISRAKKQKLPPTKKGSKRLNISKDHTEPVPKQPVVDVDKSIGQNVARETDNTIVANDVTVDEIEKKQFLETVTDDSSWLDYLESDFVSHDNETTAKCNDVEFRDDVEKYDVQMNESVQDVVEGTATSPDLSERLASLGIVDPDPREVVNDDDIVPKVDDKLVHEKSSCSPENTFENEQSLQVQGSEIILLPHKEEIRSNSEILPGEAVISSSLIDCEQDSLDFGFGDLFNEPEIIEGPKIKTVSSESDPDEVDNSNSQVSVESCLAYFTKPELLSSIEHGWNCENCSKTILEQKRQLRKKDQKVAGKIEENEAENNVQNTSDAYIKENVTGSTVDDEDAKSGKIDLISEIDNSQESNGGLRQFAYEENVSGITSENSAKDSTISVCSSNDVEKNESKILGDGSESEENSDEERNSKGLEVKRDATKRIFINKAPLILTIHLKRFCQDHRGRLSKLNGHVDFKETIDLRPYMDPRSKERDEYKYRLSGVVEHCGTMRGGHYVSYVRGSKKSNDGNVSVWYYASDAHVRQVSLQEVLHCEAYILFYEKI